MHFVCVHACSLGLTVVAARESSTQRVQTDATRSDTIVSNGQAACTEEDAQREGEHDTLLGSVLGGALCWLVMSVCVCVF